MNILIVNRALGTLFGGGESFDINAAKYLTQRGHKVRILTGKPLLAAPNNTFPEFDITYLPSPSLRKYAYATQNWSSKLSAAFYHLDNILFEIRAYLWLQKQKSYKPEVIQCCSLFNLPTWILNKNKYQAVASWLPGPPSRLTKNVLRKLINQPHFGLYTHGSPEWELIKIGFKKQRDYEIIGPGVELQRINQVNTNRIELRRQLNIPQDASLGITTARLIPIKNHSLLFQAIQLAKQRGANWHWLVIGDGPLRAELEQETVIRGISTQVHFLGYKTQDEVHQLLSAADLFGLSSKYENFSIATLEAMGHGLACFGTEVGYLRHLIQDSGAGLVTPKDDAIAMTEVLMTMSNPTRRAQFGICGRSFVNSLDWPRVAEDIETHFLKIIQGRTT